MGGFVRARMNERHYSGLSILVLVCCCFVSRLCGHVEEAPRLGLIARTGDSKAMEEAIAKIRKQGENQHESIDSADSYGWTPLLWAVDAGNAATVRVLLEHGANPHVKMGSNGWTVLMWSAGMPQGLPIVNLLVNEFKVNPNIGSGSGFSPLMAACKADSLEALKALLAAGANPNTADADGVTALMVAAAHSKLPILALLVEAGASVSSLSGDGWSALSFAAASNRQEAVTWLLSSGAKTEVDGQPSAATALSLASGRGFEKIVAALLDGAPSKDILQASLHIAASSGHASVIKALLDAGAVSGASDVDGGLRPLAAAAAQARLQAVQVLLAAGDNVLPLATDPPGGAPLEAAVLGVPKLNMCSRGSLHKMPGNASPQAAQVTDVLQTMILRKLEVSDKRKWNREELRAWLCAKGGKTGCLLAAVFNEAGMDGMAAFGADTWPAVWDMKEFDAWDVLHWSYEMHRQSRISGPYLQLATAIAVKFARLHPEWFAKAASSGMQEILEAMSEGALEPWAEVGARGETVLQLASTSTAELMRALEPAMHKHLDERPIDEWSSQDVFHWALLKPTMNRFAYIFKENEVDGHALRDLLVKSGVCATETICANADASSIAINLEIIVAWSMDNNIPQAAQLAAKGIASAPQAYKILWVPEYVEAEVHQEEIEFKPSLGEKLIMSGSSYASAVDTAFPSLNRYLRSTSPNKWKRHDVSAILRAASLPSKLIEAVLASGASGYHLAGDREWRLLAHWPPLGPNLTASVYMSVMDPGRLLSWSCHWGLINVSLYVVDLASNLELAGSGIAAWKSLHMPLPHLGNMVPGGIQGYHNVTLMQCAARHDWKDLTESVGGIVAARAITIPVAVWTVTDVLNWLYVVGQGNLGDAMFADGITGEHLAKLKPHPEQMLIRHSKSASLPFGIPVGELLYWAINNGNKNVAAFLLENTAEVHRPAWIHGSPIGPSPHELAVQQGMNSTAALLAKRIAERLSTANIVEWTEIDVSNFLNLKGLQDFAPIFKEDWIRGKGLASLAQYLEALEADKSTVNHDKLAQILARTRSDPSKALAVMEWALKENACYILSIVAMQMLPPSSVPLLLSDMGDGSSLLDMAVWNRACRPSTKTLVAMAEQHLADLHLSRWKKHEVAAWLYGRDRSEWVHAFAKDNITGLELQQHPGLAKGEAKGNNVDVKISARQWLQWALDGGHYHVARQVMRSDSSIILGELGDGHTVLAALSNHRQHLPEDFDNAQSLVLQRLERLEVSDWSFPDLANNLFLTEQSDALLVAKAVRMDGAAFQGLVDRKGMDALMDPAAMVEYAVEDGKADLLEAVLGLMELPSDLLSSMLLTAAWNDDINALQVLLKHGAEINWQNSNKYTALMRASLRGHRDIVEYLLSAGANPDLTNSRKSTAQQLAENKQHMDIVKAFRHHQQRGSAAKKEGGKRAAYK